MSVIAVAMVDCVAVVSSVVVARVTGMSAVAGGVSVMRRVRKESAQRHCYQTNRPKCEGSDIPVQFGSSMNGEKLSRLKSYAKSSRR